MDGLPLGIWLAHIFKKYIGQGSSISILCLAYYMANLHTKSTMGY